MNSHQAGAFVSRHITKGTNPNSTLTQSGAHPRWDRPCDKRQFDLVPVSGHTMTQKSTII